MVKKKKLVLVLRGLYSGFSPHLQSSDPSTALISMWAQLLSGVRLFVTPRTVAYQAPPSMGFTKQEYWSGVPLPLAT